MSNINDVRVKNIPLELDGKTYHLRFTLNAFAELEDAYGSVDEAMAEVQKGRIKAIRKLLWAGLLHENADITEFEVGNMLDTSNLQNFSKVLTQALGVALPKQDADVPVGGNPNVQTQK